MTWRQQRAVGVWGWAEQWLHDLRYAWRRLLRESAFTAAVVVTLAIAMGMNTATFSVFNAVVLRPLAFPFPDRLVWLSTVRTPEEQGDVIGPDFADWRAQAASFERMAAYGTVDYTLTSPRGALRVRAAMVSEDFWDLSGATPGAGHLPRADEDDVVVLTDTLAERWFGGASEAIGHVVALNGEPVTIVGVMSESFRFHLPGFAWSGFRPRDVEVYRPITVSPQRGGMVALLNVVGRLKPGATIEGARAEIEAIRATIEKTHPDPYGGGLMLRVVPLDEQLIGRAKWALRVLFGAAAFVLLVACANIANLLLARASARRKEIAVRMSVGAGRARVLRQLLIEGLVLAGLGNAAGLLLAHVGVAAIQRIDPYAIPRLAEAAIDGRVVAAVLAASVLTTSTFALVPAFALWRTSPHDALRSGNRTLSPARGSARTRTLLVAGEVALALVLLIGAGLLVRSAWRMHSYQPGFEPARVLTATIAFTGPQYRRTPRSTAFATALLDRLRSAPGVSGATISTHGYMLSQDLTVEGEPAPAPQDLGSQPPIVINATAAAMREVMAFRMLRGRWFTDGEAAIVLNESLARRELGDRDPIGRHVRMDDAGPLLTIVGVVQDLRFSRLDAPAEPEAYLPYQHFEDGLFGLTTLIRTPGDPLLLAPILRAAVAELDPTLVADDVMTLEQWLADGIASRRLYLFLLSTFAASALLLAIVGIYGVMAYSVAQRVPEIGVRMALGATRRHVVGLIVRQGMAMTAIGITVGVLGALSLTRLMESLLYDVQPTDPATFAVITVALVATGFVACSVPALRAAFVDPAITLRDE